MLNKCLAFAAALVLSATAYAQSEINDSGLPANSDMQSEYFFQAPAGHSDLSVRAGYQTRTTKVDAPGAAESTLSGIHHTGIAYEYGINEMWALEGALYFSSLETDGTPKTKVSGLENPEIFLKGRSATDWGNLRYGAAVGLGFEKNKTPTATQDGNMATGGYSVMPYLGADMNAGGGIVGGRVSYEYLMDRTSDDGSNVDIKRKDGNELGLSVFYEYFFADMLIGGAVNYESADKVKFEQGAVTGEEDAHTTTGISLYSRMPMGTWALIPRLDYDFSRSHYAKYDDLRFAVTARFGF